MAGSSCARMRAKLRATVSSGLRRAPAMSLDNRRGRFSHSGPRAAFRGQCRSFGDFRNVASRKPVQFSCNRQNRGSHAAARATGCRDAAGNRTAPALMMPAKFGRRDEPDLDARLGRKPATLLAGLDEERMHLVGEPSRAGRERCRADALARADSPVSSINSRLAASIAVFALIDRAGRQFPGEGFDRRAVLPHDRDFAAGRTRQHGDVVGLADGVIDFRLLARRELDLALDDVGPRREPGGPSAF